MKLRVTRVIALALWTAIIASAVPAGAQPRQRTSYPPGSAIGRPIAPKPRPQTARPPRTASPVRLAQQSVPANGARRPQPTAAPTTEELPTSHPGPVISGPHPGGFVGEGYYEPEYSPGYYGEGPCCDDCYGSPYGCDDGCCNSCGSNSCDGCCIARGGIFYGLLGCVTPPGRYYITADYLYARADFSSAISFLDQQEIDDEGFGSDTFNSLDFNYESSYRFGGGYRLCGCGEEVRFLFTRLSSTADAIAPGDSETSSIFVPYLVVAEPGGQTLIHADVDVKTYDLEFAKIIQLGSQGGCGCGDPCGGACCGDPCGCGCPAWDVTWTGGFRFADTSWNRSYAAFTEEGDPTSRAVSVMDFRGGGVKVGLEGRRYFMPNGALSVYMKGDLSLLLGDVDLTALFQSVDGFDSQIAQTISNRQIIPVTEIETGLTGHVTCNSSITTGYMFSAWHDLGFRDEFEFPTQLETNYDDANILGFNGFFARLEVAF